MAAASKGCTSVQNDEAHDESLEEHDKKLRAWPMHRLYDKDLKTVLQKLNKLQENTSRKTIQEQSEKLNKEVANTERNQ